MEELIFKDWKLTKYYQLMLQTAWTVWVTCITTNSHYCKSSSTTQTSKITYLIPPISSKMLHTISKFVLVFWTIHWSMLENRSLNSIPSLLMDLHSSNTLLLILLPSVASTKISYTIQTLHLTLLTFTIRQEKWLIYWSKSHPYKNHL